MRPRHDPRFLLRAAAFVIAFAATALAGQAVKTDELPADTLIVLQRGACEHRCSVYNVVIFADGSVIFDGRYYVRRTGVIRTRITREALRGLLDAAAAAHFFDMKQSYAPGSGSGCEQPTSDAPTAILTIGSGGRLKTVVHYLGCRGAESERLSQLEVKIDQATHTRAWVK